MPRYSGRKRHSKGTDSRRNRKWSSTR
jgi:hypothetical protein